MAKSWNEKIDDNTNWNGDESTEGLPVAGGRVQEYIRENIVNLKGAVNSVSSATGTKFGSVAYEGGTLVFRDEEGGTELGRVTLTGTSYIVTVDTDRASNFYILTSEESATISLTPKTESVEFGQTERTYFPEDYTFKLEVDSGSGYYDYTPASNTIQEGGTAIVDVRPYVKTGANKVRIVVTGKSSNQPKTLAFTCSLTNLTFSCDHYWWSPWIESNSYSLNNIYFSGNIPKTLKVKIDDTVYSQTFSAGENYNTAPYTYDLNGKFPGTTGVHTISAWMEGGDGVTTAVTTFDIICVARGEETAQIAVINELPAAAKNYDTFKFAYATYNITSLPVKIKANVEGEEQIILEQTIDGVATRTRYEFTTNLSIPTEVTEGLSLDVTLGDQEKTLPVDNSASYAPVPGATLYINPAIRYNGTADQTELHNTAPGASVTTYAGEFEKFTFTSSDGWTVDPDGNKALVVRAGSSIFVPALKPIAQSVTGSVTLEFLYQVRNVADYDTPVMTIMDSETYDKDRTFGIVLFPTRLQLHSNVRSLEEYQRLDLPEGRLIHLAIVFQQNYGGTGLNLCRIFVNGCENCTFEYSGTTRFVGEGGNPVRMGQNSTDFYLYMMRSYNSALEGPAILTNFLNAMVETAERSRPGVRGDNAILDGGQVDYDLAKKAGFNTLVYVTDDELPSLDNPSTKSLKLDLRFEYSAHPEWNVTIKGIPCDGQGTTSMKYKKWNLRNKIKDAATVWEYPNLKDESGNVLVKTGKDGYIAGFEQHPRVSTITAKKNVASQPQGHKMGATGIYNDLHVKCEGTDMLPNDSTRVATYQHPFLGFQEFSDGSHKFIGLYTCGPDKKDKKTFGYNETSKFPKLMMIEGPNHAPLMTRFLVPWVDVFYDFENETLAIGNEANNMEGWDADIAADYSTDSGDDAAAILALYESEFKPAYDAIFYTNPYLASIAETGKTLDEINADVLAFRNGKTGGVNNDLLTLYNENYELVYFRIATQQYEVLPKSTHDMLAYLGLSGTPTTTELLAARSSNFIAKVGAYVDLKEAYFHECFVELFGASDNHAKNTYWRKFKSIAEGGKWGFNQDDLDTIFQNDNNGQDTKEYFVEPGDLNAIGSDIFQGASSAFWTQLRRSCGEQLRVKMGNIVDALVEIADERHVSTSFVRGNVFNAIKCYFWDNSSLYFPATAYNEDTVFAYLDVWRENPAAEYNSVPPLTQIHGDHYEVERAWVEKRIDYIMSKYRIAGFDGSASDGLNTLEFTPASLFPMKVTPAMELYPRWSLGGAKAGVTERTKAGDECTLNLSSDGSTTVYVKAIDLMSDLGDLSGLEMSTRGGSTTITLNISGKRLRKVKVGDADASKVKFNADSLSISGDSIEEVDATHAVTVKNEMDFAGCPRLRRVEFMGSSIPCAKLPVGGRVEFVHLPDTTRILFLHTLGLLKAENLVIEPGGWPNIQSLYINNCTQFNPITIMREVYTSENSNLQFLTLIWSNIGEMELENPVEDFAMIRKFVEDAYDPETGKGVGCVKYDEQTRTISNSEEAPILEGTIIVDVPVFRYDVEKITERIPSLTIKLGPYVIFYQSFKDDVIRKQVAKMPFADGTGVFEDAWKQNMKQSDLRALVENMTEEEQLAVTSWDELGEIEVVNNQTNQTGFYFQVNKLQNLEKLVLPNNTFGSWNLQDMPNLKEVVVGENTSTNTGNCYSDIAVFRNCTSLEHLDVKNMYRRISIGSYGVNDLVACCTNLKDFKADVLCPNSSNNISLIGAFRGCVNLEKVEINKLGNLPGNNYNLGSMFKGCSKLSEVNINTFEPSLITNADATFQDCTSLKSIPSWFDLSKIANIQYTFRRSGIEQVGDITIRVSQGNGNGEMFKDCTSLTQVGNIDLTLSARGKPNNMFRGCTNLAKVGNVTITLLESGDQGGTIDGFFQDCTSLTEIGTINLNTRALGVNDFLRNTGFTSFGDLNYYGTGSVSNFLGSCQNLTTIGNINCPNVTGSVGVGVATGNPKLMSIGNISFENATEFGNGISIGNDKLTTVGDIYTPNITGGNTTIYSSPSLTTVGVWTVGPEFYWLSNFGASSVINFGGFRGLQQTIWDKSDRTGNLVTLFGTGLSAQSVHNIVNEAIGGPSDDAKIYVRINSTAYDRWVASEFYSNDIAMCNQKHMVITKQARP